MPEIQRELTIVRGAATTVLHRARQLEEQLKPIIRQYPEAIREEPMKMPGEDTFPVNSPLGQEVRGIYQELQLAEDMLDRLLNRVAV